MKAMWIAFLAMIVISLGAWYGLSLLDFSASDRGSGDAVRID